MISPAEYEGYLSAVVNQNIIEKIDDKIKKYRSDLWYPWIDIIIDGEYSLEIRNSISRKYIEAGWFGVCHKTSSENNEVPGLTHFIFCTEDTFQKWKEASKGSFESWNIVK